MAGIDWVILGIYFTVVLGVGAALRRFTRTSTDFFLAGRALPAWVCGLAFISANLGAQEVIGMAAHSMTAARRTPLIGAFPKMLFPALVILPGLLALAVGGGATAGIIPNKIDAATGLPTPDYDMAIPALLVHYFPPGLLGLGLTALLASFMSGMAGNVTAFNTVWQRDLTAEAAAAVLRERG